MAVTSILPDMYILMFILKLKHFPVIPVSSLHLPVHLCIELVKISLAICLYVCSNSRTTE
jgi:hypothetical protein